jgi:NitT/TauT family transport system ATP-binding protein
MTVKVREPRSPTAWTKQDSDEALRLIGVGHVFTTRTGSSVRALQNIDLTLARSEFFSIVGPSGCGKSTLLEIASGLLAPSEGSVFFEGKPVSGQPLEGLGVVFQDDASFPWLNVRDNIAFGLRRQGAPASEIRKRVDYALDFMGLGDFARAYPAQLSGGMRQRVCIARTLVLRPRLIVLDEPFGALDQQTRLLMGEELLRVWRETSATVMLITHSLDEAAMLSDRVGVMSARPGHLVETFVTDWPRQRDSSIASDARFGKLNAEMWAILRTEAMTSMKGRRA